MTPLLLQVLPILNVALGLLLAFWTLTFLLRIVLTWYPQIDLEQGLWRVVAMPTEPLLSLTRKVVAPIGGVDVTPVIWVGLISLVRELLVGQQGVLSLVMMRAQTLAWSGQHVLLDKFGVHIAADEFRAIQHLEMEINRGGNPGDGAFVQCPLHSSECVLTVGSPNDHLADQRAGSGPERRFV